MSIDLRHKVIDELAEQEVIKLILTGGEVVQPREFEKLMDTIEYASKKREETGYPKYIKVQTNGSFAKNEGEARRVLGRLKEAGTDDINVASYDKYHDEWLEILGLEGAPELACKVASEMGFEDVDLTGANKYHNAKSIPAPIPIGRAVECVSKSEWDTSEKCCVPYTKTVEIDHAGNVRLCWNTFLTIGNLGEKSLKIILEEARENETVRQIAGFGFRSVPPEKLETTKERLEEDLSELGECGTCYKHYKRRSENGQTK